jgi:hypothetical protein
LRLRQLEESMMARTQGQKPFRQWLRRALAGQPV